ncbi:MAG TPA: putative nucleotidyltransferase substrate binding domain-containing protein [Usitatibacter sp.]|nr:putative nucleotidyltransferase substrate binding domain-containing protein [Usitatibacter sp.]
MQPYRTELTTLVAGTVAHLRRHAPFDRMEEAHVRLLASRLKLAYYPADTVILDHAMGVPAQVFIIKQGAVMVGPADQGAAPEIVLQEGECFPLGAVVAHRPVSGAYRATHDTFCYQLTAEDFRLVMEQSPVFHDFCTRRIAHMLQHALVNLQSDMALNVSQRQPLDRTLAQIVARAPVMCEEDTPIGVALAGMEREGIGSMLVGHDGRATGIFTLKDLLARVALRFVDLSRPIREVMTPDPVSLPHDAFAYEAALVMSERGIHHLVVMNGERVAGLISEKDLFAMQRRGLRQVGSAIRDAATVDTVVALAGDVREMTRDLFAQGVNAQHLVQILATLNERLSRRIIQLELADSGVGVHEFCWIAMGSEGRQERTLASDQDNGILFADSAGDADRMRERLLPVARRINTSLARAGFTECRGKIMAGNPQWCMSETEWRRAFAGWISAGDPRAVLNGMIFFDFRGLYGNVALADSLRAWLAAEASGNERFLRQLAQDALTNRPPLGIVRDFAVGDDKDHPGTIDLKINGAILFVDPARVYALAYGLNQTNTVERLRAAAERGLLAHKDCEAWIAAFNYLQHFRLRHQHAQIARGETPDNHLNPDRLNELDRRLLKETLRSARNLQQRLALDYQLWQR